MVIVSPCGEETASFWEAEKIRFPGAVFRHAQTAFSDLTHKRELPFRIACANLDCKQRRHSPLECGRLLFSLTTSATACRRRRANESGPSSDPRRRLRYAQSRRAPAASLPITDSIRKVPEFLRPSTVGPRETKACRD